MLTLKVIGSGSKGNGYLLRNERGNTLILECGMPLIETKKALGFDLSSLDGIYLSHGHSDHIGHLSEYELIGADIFAPYESDKEIVRRRMGAFDISAFRLPHGEINSYGAFIRDVLSGETVIFCTDFEFCKYTFRNKSVNHFIVECNYQDEYVDLDAVNKAHKLGGHCSLKTCKNFIKANITPSMKSVILIHMGMTSTNPRECIAEIAEVVPPNVSVDYARQGETYELATKCF